MMYGWWSNDYLKKNSNTVIYIYSTLFGPNVMVIGITDSIGIPPDNYHGWACLGQIHKLINTINVNNSTIESVKMHIELSKNSDNLNNIVNMDNVDNMDNIDNMDNLNNSNNSNKKQRLS